MNPLHGVAVLALVEDQPDQVYEGEEDQGGRQDGLADVEEAPGDLTVAGPPELADLNITLSLVELLCTLNTALSLVETFIIC